VEHKGLVARRQQVPVRVHPALTERTEVPLLLGLLTLLVGLPEMAVSLVVLALLQGALILHYRLFLLTVWWLMLLL
jgi:hypothetical protein